jgi:hypothetical protein
MGIYRMVLIAAELVMSLTDECPLPNHKYKVMDWRDPELPAGGPYAKD